MVAQAPRLEQRELLRKIKASYYSVRAPGVKGFQCIAAPAWKSDETISNDQALLKQVETIVYSLTVDFGAPPEFVTITPVRPDGAQTDQRGDKAIQAYGHITSGFFQLWLTISAGFIPDDLSGGHFRITQKPDHTYLLSSAYGDLELDADYVLRKMSIIRPAGTYVMIPTFIKVAGGRLLVAEFELSGNNFPKTQISMQYEDTQGLKLPNKMVITSSRGWSDKQEIKFKECHVN
jgi:hypothetical protein